MTVESSKSTQMSVTRKSRQDVIRTIQEITPFDEMTINRAIEACQDSDGRYSIDQVLNVLMDDVSNLFVIKEIIKFKLKNL